HGQQGFLGTGFKSQKKLTRQRKQHVIRQRRTGNEQKRRHPEKNLQRGFFILVQPRRQKFPHLIENKRKSNEQRSAERQLKVRKEGFLQTGIYHAALFGLAKRLH